MLSFAPRPSIFRLPMDADIPAPAPGFAPAVPPSVYHRPVLVAEVLSALAPAPGRLIVDGTIGGGGHTRALLEAGATVLGLDRDQAAIDHCRGLFAGAALEEKRLTLRQADYRDLGRVLDELAIYQVDGLLLDLGVSSAQLDRGDRGFSFQKAGPLDMRMDQSARESASDLVNTAGADELTRIFRVYGEEPAAARVAAAIVQARDREPITGTLALARVVERVIPKHGPRHPATRVFQALRMAVNDELGALAAGLEASIERLRPGGRLAVITFHSLEDRLVKTFCRETTAETIDRPEWPQPRPNPRLAFRAVTRRAVQPAPAEQHQNPRSRSAKLRALERLPVTGAAPFSARKTAV
jgi:16S rRNA (cytosine1402-N4)-methyltransferase